MFECYRLIYRGSIVRRSLGRSEYAEAGNCYWYPAYQNHSNGQRMLLLTEILLGIIRYRDTRNNGTRSMRGEVAPQCGISYAGHARTDWQIRSVHKLAE